MTQDSLHERGKAAENVWARKTEYEDLERMKSKLDERQIDAAAS